MGGMWFMLDAVMISEGTVSSHDRPEIYMFEHFTCLLHIGADN